MFDASPPPAKASFTPAWGLRSAFVQSALASKRPARWLWRRRGVDLDANSTLYTFDTADELGAPVKLTGWHTPSATAKTLVVLIHGWEGSHESSYLYGLSCALHRAGHALFRLNLRDHGSTHHGLNEAMFHSARMAEVLDAVRQARVLDGDGRELVVIGFSLGGNFALRVGLKGPAAGIRPRLCIGISPAVNPGSTLRAIDEGPKVVHRYFLDKWHKTMAAKAAAFPGRYDFTRHRQLSNFTEITRAFVEEHTDYGALDHYLAQYTLTPEMLMASPTPLAVITAEDDSVCPPADFAGLEVRDGVVSYQATALGGHCGFITNWRMECWLDDEVLKLVERAN